MKLPKHLAEERVDIILWLRNKGFSIGDIVQILTYPISRQRVHKITVEGRLQHTEPIRNRTNQ